MSEEYVTCPKCGVTQRPGSPICIHLTGKKGGDENLNRKGREFYVEIGKKGGVRTKQVVDYAKIGRKGGQAARDKLGVEHYRKIGRKGGEKIRDERGTPFYEEIGAKGGARMKELCAKGKKVESDEKE